MTEHMDEQAPRTLSKIGLAFSGGGVRALVFHLGVLQRLATDNLLEKTVFISSVSGGSLAVGLVMAHAGNRWPTSKDYLDKVFAEIRACLTSSNIQSRLLFKTLCCPGSWFSGRAHILAKLFKELWGVRGKLADLPEHPRWIINATCFETGKNWRFMKERMGDYITNYVLNPEFNLSEALAASAAVPGLIGPIYIQTKEYQWVQIDRTQNSSKPTPPIAHRLRLWDGGVYDNLGLEPLIKPNEGYCEDIDFLISSDASSPLLKEERTFSFRFPFFIPPYRLLDIAESQVCGLRSRLLIQHFKRNRETGVLMRMGNNVQAIYEKAGVMPPGKFKKAPLTDMAVNQALMMKTTLTQLSSEEFDSLSQHGFETADSVLAAYCPAQFKSCL